MAIVFGAVWKLTDVENCFNRIHYAWLDVKLLRLRRNVEPVGNHKFNQSVVATGVAFFSLEVWRIHIPNGHNEKMLSLLTKTVFTVSETISTKCLLLFVLRVVFYILHIKRGYFGNVNCAWKRFVIFVLQQRIMTPFLWPFILLYLSSISDL